MATAALPDSRSSTPSDGDRRRATRWLQALNFFMADMQAGIGPFLGVFLQQRGWQTGPIGTVMTLGGVAGMAMTVPAGAFIDHTDKKRWVVVITGICTVLASFLILWSQSGIVVGVSQVATAIAGAAIGPAVTGMTLGVVGKRVSTRRTAATRRGTMRAIWSAQGFPAFSAGSSAWPPSSSSPPPSACWRSSRSCRSPNARSTTAPRAGWRMKTAIIRRAARPRGSRRCSRTSRC